MKISKFENTEKKTLMEGDFFCGVWSNLTLSIATKVQYANSLDSGETPTRIKPV